MVSNPNVAFKSESGSAESVMVKMDPKYAA